MSAFWSGTVAQLLALTPREVTAALAHAGARGGRGSEPQQLRAWEETVALLHEALLPLPETRGWRVLLEHALLRLGKRPDVLLLTPRGVFVLEVKLGADRATRADREQVEDYALDLQDFHAGCRHHPIIPVLVATRLARPCAEPFLPMSGVAGHVLEANGDTLSALLADAFRLLPAGAPMDVDAWEAAPYRPVPALMQAAVLLYRRHDVAELLSARADGASLARTTAAVHDALAWAREGARKVVVFVTGIPGAGKTLCGLNCCLAGAPEGTDAPGATFLTGNPSLVHVLREALARDAIARGAQPRAARQGMEGVIQALPRFRDKYAAHAAEVPPERVVVIDEAQRSWMREHAVRKSQDRPVRLTDGEPGHLLDAMARHEGWAGMVCLVGGGQEIHSGEGGLAEWGRALAARPEWSVRAAPDALHHAEPRRRLPRLPGLREDPTLHLDVALRQVRSPRAAEWVEALLAGNAAAAAALLHGEAPPFVLTRSLEAARAALRGACRGTQRCGLVASSGARRLRAEGLGAELAHMDACAVARWFLDRFPRDVRASDALELPATEFSVQGLELDHVGLCWDADLVRAPPGAVAGPDGEAGGWRVRAFRGTDWQVVRDPEAMAHGRNTYRVLLTRARQRTVIFVPRGSGDDRTRDPALYDEVAAFLLLCGVPPLPEVSLEPSDAHAVAEAKRLL